MADRTYSQFALDSGDAEARRRGGPGGATATGRIPALQLVAFLAIWAFALWRCWVHEPWFDELHAYLIAREAQGLGELFTNLRNDGHPGLWHLLLFGVTRIVPSPDARRCAGW